MMLKTFAATLAITFAVGLATAACTILPAHEVVAAGETAVSYKSNTSSPPDDLAAAHCKQFGRKAKYRGGIPLGEPATWSIYGYDCVK